MAFHVVEEIRKKSREEWYKMIQSRVVNLRIWIQENGEAAFAVGLALGFLIVFLHKFVIFLVAVSVIIGFTIYQLSYPASELERLKAESPDATRQDVVEDEAQGKGEGDEGENSDRNLGDSTGAPRPDSNGDSYQERDLN